MSKQDLLTAQDGLSARPPAKTHFGCLRIAASTHFSVIAINLTLLASCVLSGCSGDDSDLKIKKAPTAAAPAPAQPATADSAKPADPVAGASKPDTKDPGKTEPKAADVIEQAQSQFQMAFSDNGRYAASGGKNATIRMFNLETGVISRSFAGQNSPVSSITFSRDASSLAAGNINGQMMIWTTGMAEGLDETERQSLKSEERRKFAGHTGPVRSLAYRPDSRELASGGEDGTIRYWKLPIMRPTTLRMNSAGVVLIEGVPNNRMVIAGTKDGAVDLWDLNESRTSSLLPANAHTITALTCSQDGAFAAAGDGSGKVRIIDLVSRKMVADFSVHQGAVTGVRFHSNKSSVVSIGLDGKTRITEFQVTTAKSAEKELAKLPSKGRLLMCSHRGNYAAVVGGSGNTIEVADLQTGTLLHSLVVDGAEVLSLAWAAKDQAIVAGDTKGRLSVWRMPDGQKLLESQYHEGSIRALAGNVHKPEMVSGGADGKIQKWFQPGLPESITEACATDATILSVSPNGKRLAVGTSSGLIQLFNTEERTKLDEYPKVDSAVAMLEWSPESDWLAAADSEGNIRIWQVENGGRSLVAIRAGVPIVQLTFQSSGPTLVAATKGGEFKTWKYPFQNKQTLSGHVHDITSILSNPEGSHVVTGGKDKACRLYEVADGKSIRVFQGPENEITCLAQAADEAWIAAGDLDGRISMWWTSTSESAGSVQIVGGNIRSLASSPSNNRIASASSDGMVRIWQLPFVPPVEMDEEPQNAVLAVSTDGKRVAISRYDRTIAIRDTVTGQEIRVLSGHTGNVTALAWSRDNAFVVSGGQDQTVCLWSVEDGKQLVKWEHHPASIQAVSVSGDNEVLSACTVDGRLAKYNRSTSEENELRKSQPEITAIAQSPSGRRLSVASGDGSVEIVNGETGETLKKTAPGEPITAMAWCGDDRTWVSLGSSRKVTFWKMDEPDTTRGWINSPPGMTKLAVSADGTRVLGNSGYGLLRLWDSRGTILEAFPWPEESTVESLALPDNGTLVVASGGDGRTTAFRPAIIRVIKAHAGGTEAVSFIDEQVVVSLGADGKIRSWNLSDGTQARQFDGCPAKLVEMVAAPAASKLVALTEDRKLFAWNLSDGSPCELTAGLRDSQFLRMGLQSDGTQLAILNSRGAVSIVRMSDLREISQVGNSIRSTPALAFLKSGTIAYAEGLQAILVGDQESNGMSREPHGGPIVGAANIPSKNEIISVGTDGLIKVWTADGKFVRTLVKADVPVRSFAISPDGAEILLLTSDNRVKCFNYSGEKAGEWNLGFTPKMLGYTMGKGSPAVVTWSDKQFRLGQSATGKIYSTLGAPGSLTASAISPGQSDLYTASNDGKLVRYVLGPTGSISAEQRDVQSLALSDNCELVASAGDDATIAVWKVQNLALKCRLKGHTKSVTAVSFGRDDSLVVSASADRTIRIWNAEKSKLILSIPLPSVPLSMSLAPDDHFAAVAVDDKAISIYDLHSGKPTEGLVSTRASVLQARYSSKGLVTLGNDKRICGWDSNTSPEANQRQVLATGMPTGLDVYPDGSHFVIAGSDAGIKAFDFHGQAATEFAAAKMTFKSISVSPDGAHLAGASENVVTIWNLSDGRVAQSVSMERPVRSVQFEFSGASIVVMTDDRRMTRIRTADGAILEYIDTVADVAIAPAVLSSREVATLESDGRARIYLPALEHSQEGHRGAVTSLVYSGDGSVLFSGGADGRIVGWSADRQKTLVEFTAGSSPVNEISISADQKSLIASYQDDAVRIWSVNGKTSEPESIFMHKAPVKSAKTSTDGMLLASGGEDRVVHLWMMATGRELVQFHGHEGTVERLSISRDRKRVVSFGNEDAIRIWNVPENAITAATMGQVNQSSGRVAVAQPQDKEIATLQRQLSMAQAAKGSSEAATADGGNVGAKAQSNSDGGETVAFRGSTDELERRLRVLRSGEPDSAPQTEAQRMDAELRQTEMQMRSTPPGPAKEKLRLDWRRLKRQRELEDMIAMATGADQQALRDELESLSSIDPRKIRLAEEEYKSIPGIDEKHLQSFKTDYNFDFAQFQPVKLAISPDLKTIAAGRESANLRGNRSVRGVLQLWDVETGVQLRSWREVENQRVDAVVFTPNQQFIYTLPDLTMFNISTGMSRVLTAGASTSVNKEGTLIGIGMASSVLAEEPILRFVDTETGNFRPQKMDGYESKVTSILFNPKGKSIFVAIRERLAHRIVELDLQSLHQSAPEIDMYKHKEPWHQGSRIPGIESLCISTDEKYLVTYGRYSETDYRLMCWTKQDGKWVVRNGFMHMTSKPQVRSGTPGRMWIIQDSSLLVIEGYKGTLMWIDLATGQSVTRDIAMTNWGLPETARSGDGSWYVTGDDGGRLHVWDLQKGEVSYAFRAHSGPVVGVALSQDGSHIISAGEENVIKIWKRQPTTTEPAPKPTRTKPRPKN